MRPPCEIWGEQLRERWQQWNLICIGLFLHEAGIFVITEGNHQ
jgi:hypothetical protein